MNGYSFDPEKGLVIGKFGKPIGSVKRCGYIVVFCNGRNYMAHRLIWAHVFGPIPIGLEINHKNGIKTDNRIANLEIVTKSENARHAVRTGLINFAGERNGRAKLTNDDVKYIKRSLEPSEALAARFGVAGNTVRRIRSGKGWTHVNHGAA